MIAPEIQNSFTQFLVDYNITNELIMNNVERYKQYTRVTIILFAHLIKNHFHFTPSAFKVEREVQSVQGRMANNYALNHFWSTQEINDYLNLLVWLHSDICSLEIVSSSSQGQLIRALRISLKGRGQIDGSRPIIAIDAGIHAREWIAPMTAIHFIQELVENSAKYATLLDKVDVVIIPSMNPDGYDFSHSSVNTFISICCHYLHNWGTILIGIFFLKLRIDYGERLEHEIQTVHALELTAIETMRICGKVTDLYVIKKIRCFTFKNEFISIKFL